MSERTDDIAERLLADDNVSGAMVLSTCNRVEVLLDTVDDVNNQELRAILNRPFDGAPNWDLFLGEAALRHLFRVAAGLDSMVVGEREISGQLRRSLTDAQTAGQASLPLSIAVEEALRTSRRIARETSLEGAGRSVVSTGLDLLGVTDWPSTSVLIVGTGAYAGAVVAALRARGATDIAVHSDSGRGATFAAGHGTGHAQRLSEGLARADVVVTCRGHGAPSIHAADITRPALFLDLSLRRDVADDVAAVPGVRIVDLAAVQASVGTGIAQDTRHAERLVARGMSDAMTRLRARVIDPAVVGLRETVMGLVDDEVGRLPHRDLTHDDAALALRRLATRLLHIPSTRARLAAEQGRTDAYLDAMAELYGIGDERAIDPDRLEEQTCPVTNLKVCDLETIHSVVEAM
ncbi:MAG: glutamyl-tRNA reductase [Arachnia sp.]